MSEEKTIIIGIDLGTTYSCIAYVDEFGRETTIPNAEGDRLTPSVVFFDGDTRIVGKEAKNVALMFPDQVVAAVKRHMGEADWVKPYNDVEYRAEEVSSFILRKLAGDAEMVLGRPVTDVVISCPAYFGINEREATARAGEIAGLNVRSIINEPTAAAIAFGLHAEQDQVVLVYDLGGGTFDITMIEIKEGEIIVIATGGDHHLGGLNWDNVVINHLAGEWKATTGSTEDPIEDPETLQDLFVKAEHAKRSLSARNKTDVAVIHAGQRERLTLTRETFNELTAHLLERSINYTHSMLEEAKKKGYDHFDQFLLVGGSSRMPQVIERVRAEFGIEPKLIDPDEVVAKGAALFGHKLAIDEAIRIKIESWGIVDDEDVTPEVTKRAQEEVAEEEGMALPSVRRMNVLSIENVTSRSFGVQAISRTTGSLIVSNLIQVNARVPAETTQLFGTAEANQENAEIRILENIVPEATASVEESAEIGTAILPLPPGLPADSPIEVTFQLDEQGRLHASALEVTQNRTIEVDIETPHVISQEEFEAAKDRSTQIVVQ